MKRESVCLRHRESNKARILKNALLSRSPSYQACLLFLFFFFFTNTSSHFINPKPSPVNTAKIQIDLVCLYPSIHSLKFQRFGVTQEFSTAVQCLPINNEEQTRVRQELYPLCFSSRCPLLPTKRYMWALMVRFLLCHQCLDARQELLGEGGVVPSRLQTSYQYFVHRYVCLASLRGFCVLQI